MALTISVLFFLIGVCFGSFYNVVGLRTPKRITFLSNRSRCNQCHQTLCWYELIPVFSYIFQIGKCRKCKNSISLLYPFVEGMTGACFMLAYLQFDLTPELFQTLVLISICAIVFVTDITYMIIPNKVLLFFLPLFTIFNMINPSTDWYNNIFGAITGFLLIGVIILISRGGMGIGDMKLLGLLGLLLGFERTLLTFFIAVCVGSIIGIGLMLGKKRSSQHAIPFAPFLVLGAIMSMMYGDDMIAVYLSLLQV